MTHWQCGLVGKHPTSPDYFSLGPAGDQLVPIFSWIRTGFTVPVLKALAAQPVATGWRFWMWPEGENRLICGVFRGSSDSCGRPFPLLIAGTVCPVGRELRWDAVAEACRSTWENMEAVAGGGHRDIGALAQALAKIPAPAAPRRASFLDSPENTLIMEQAARHLEAGCLSRRIGVWLDGDSRQRWPRLLGWQYALRKLVSAGPSSLFYCEPAGYFELFYRPLNRRDGIRLMDIALNRRSTDFSRRVDGDIGTGAKSYI